MSKTKKESHEKFLDDVSRVGEHFEEFLLIVKPSRGNIDWRSSDRTWAVGAAERYLNVCHAEDDEGTRRGN